MSFMHNALWTPAEKVDLLVNVLRTNVPDLPVFLMQVLQEKGIYPKWNDTPLPTGRSLASSQQAYDDMSRPFKQQGPYNLQPGITTHNQPIASAIPVRRSYDYETFPPQQPAQRIIQPRPPRSTDSPVPIVTNGEPPILARVLALPEMTHEPQRKKRGRPSKEEAEERDRALAAQGKVHQPKKRPANKKMRPSWELSGSVRTSDVSSFAVQTPPAKTLEIREEGSSGKRRSKRQPLEEDAPTDDQQRQCKMSPQAGPRSPSDRLFPKHRERDLDILLTKDSPRPEVKTTTIGEKDE